MTRLTAITHRMIDALLDRASYRISGSESESRFEAELELNLMGVPVRGGLVGVERKGGAVVARVVTGSGLASTKRARG